jgi:hypothetical protein
VSQILQNLAQTDQLYANLVNLGIFRSDDHGLTWYLFPR